jgi:hypothetical protein
MKWRSGVIEENENENNNAARNLGALLRSSEKAIEESMVKIEMAMAAQ